MPAVAHPGLLVVDWSLPLWLGLPKAAEYSTSFAYPVVRSIAILLFSYNISRAELLALPSKLSSYLAGIFRPMQWTVALPARA